jgi:mono/diheme cytochrome c family protein
MNEMKENQKRDALATFAGMFVFLSVLAIFIGASNSKPNLVVANTGNDVVPLGAGEILVESSAEATEFAAEVELTPEPTVESSITPSPTAVVVELTPELMPEEAISQSNSITTEITPEVNVDTNSAQITSSYSPELIAQGETLFASCAGCHGQDGRGIAGLGKDLVSGEFALTTSDVDLATFIMTGRPIWDAANTTGVDMPPRGGNPALTETDITAIVAYLRHLQSGNSNDGSSASEPSASASYSSEQIALGQELFVTCTACHGQDGRGIAGLGKDLVSGEFSLTSSDADLVAFIMTGRPIWDAANTTGVDMPPRGGNPVLTETDITAIVAYLRSLQNP